MPGLDGLAVARRLTETRTCAVVILTAFSQRELIEEARDAGAMAYLVKPFQREDLVPAIEVAVARFADLATLAESEQRLSDQLEVRRLACSATRWIGVPRCVRSPSRFSTAIFGPDVADDAPPRNRCHRRRIVWAPPWRP